MKIFNLFSTFLFLCFAFLSLQSFSEEIQWIKIPARSSSGSYSLNTLFLTDNHFKSLPSLIVISHGSPINNKERPRMVPEIFLSQAHEFLQMGYAVLIVERRGYGRSTEQFSEIVGDCDHRDNKASGEIAANDILSAVNYAQSNLPINKDSIILVGHSAGGFSSLYASSLKHSGIKAVINFAGGRGAKGNQVVCSQQNLLETLAAAGNLNAVPSLWIYNENDQAFSPALAQAMYQNFTASVLKGEFFLLPEFGDDGHRLFSDTQGIPFWLPIVKQFLERLEVKK